MARKKQPGHYHHGQLDVALIETAIQLTEDKGVEAWSLAEAARTLGVSSGAPYKHYKNKTELLDAVARHGLHEVRRTLIAALNSSTEPRSQLIAVAKGMVRLAARQPTLYRLTFAGVRLNTWQQLSSADESTAFGTLRGAIADWQRAGLLRNGDEVAMAIGLWAHAHGLASLVATRRLDISERKAMTLAKDHILALLDGIGVKTA